MSDQPQQPSGNTPPPPPPGGPSYSSPPPPAAAPGSSTPPPSAAPAPGYDAPPQGYQPPAQPYQPTGGAPAYGAAPGQAALSEPESRQYAMFAHIGGILLSFVGPLIVMLVWGPRSAFTREQSVEALNFQITAILAHIAAAILTFVLPLPFGLIVWLAVLVLGIMGGLAANKGENYRYPVALRLVK